MDWTEDFHNPGAVVTKYLWQDYYSFCKTHSVRADSLGYIAWFFMKGDSVLEKLYMDNEPSD